MSAEQRFYDGIAIGGVCDFFPRAKATREVLRGVKAVSLLDVGCGGGTNCLSVAKATGATDLHGVDISGAAVRQANNSGVWAVRCNIDEEGLPFGDGRFDMVMATEVLEHVYDPDHLASEVFRVLKKDGKALISTPNLAWWANRAALLLGFQPFFTEVSTVDAGIGKLHPGQKEAVGHLRIFTRRGFHQFAKLHRFRILAEAGSPFRPIGWLGDNALFDMLDALLSRSPSLAADIVYLCEKV
jgi:SAM-dependent methyltransferase